MGDYREGVRQKKERKKGEEAYMLEMKTPLTTRLSSFEGFWGGVFAEREDVASVGEGVLPEMIVFGEGGERGDGEKASGRMEIKLVDAWQMEIYGWIWEKVVEQG